MPVERHQVDVGLGRAEWLQMRLQDVTASDVAAVCGHDKRKSILKVWAEKTGLLPPGEDTAFLRFRRWLEAAVVEALQAQRPSWEIRRAGVYLRDTELRIGATPDVVAIDPARPGFGNVQCKTVLRSVYEDDWPDGEPPLGYQLQSITEAKLLGAAWTDVAALVLDYAGSGEFILRPVPLHDGAWAQVRAGVERFWSFLDKGQRPPLTPALDEEVVKRMFPKVERAEPVDLSGDNMLPGLLEERAALKETVKPAEARLKVIDTEIKAKIGEHAAGLTDEWRMTFGEKTMPARGPSTFRELRVYRRKDTGR